MHPNNPLLSDFPLPPFSQIAPHHMLPAVSEWIARNKREIARCLEKAPSWEEVIMPLERLAETLHMVWSSISHLNAVANTPEVREAYHACLPLMTEYATFVGQHQGLYQVYQALAAHPACEQLTPVQKASVRYSLEEFRLSGIGLPEKEQERFRSLSQSLAALESRFQENVLDTTDRWHASLQERSMLEGIPEDALLLMEKAAQKAAQPGWRLTLDYPSYHAVVTYADNRELRQKLHEAYATRASDIGPVGKEWDNTEVMKAILEDRYALAHLLGYANEAEHSLVRKMAKSPEEVMDFLHTLALRVKPFAEEEWETLQMFARESHKAREVAPWDIAYYSEKLRRHTLDISEEALRPYFPLPRVLDGLFEIVSRLFDIQIVETPNREVWHPSVRFFEIHNRKGLVGKCYLDLFARSHKRGGAWMDEACVRYRYGDKIQIPVAYLTCNFREPLEGIPALLTHEEVLTLFHEFGHGLHHLLTKIECATLSGIRGVPWDVVELPSQFLENWCWQKEALAIFSGHYQTQAPLAEQALTQLKKSRTFQAGLSLMRQLMLGLFDLRIHWEYDLKKESVQSIWEDVQKRYSVTPVVPYSRLPHSFTHIFSGGYAAGYYSYLWAEVLASDAFSRFEEEGIFNPNTGRSFLENILEKGGSEPPDLLFRAFRGRDLSHYPFLKQHGLVAHAHESEKDSAL